MAAKADAVRAQEKVEAAAASDVSNKMANPGLLFTKMSFGVALVAFIVPTTFGSWVYFEQKEAAKVAKAEADENGKQAAIEIAKQHAEIRELTASLTRVSQPKATEIKHAKKIPLKPQAKSAGGTHGARHDHSRPQAARAGLRSGS